MTRVWCELAWLGGERPARGVLLEIEGERIAAVTPEAEPAGDVERLRGLTLPGLANAHSHAFQRALRGRTQAARGSFWTWREQMYRLAASLDPDGYLALARATYGEMALAGVTLVGEFHYVHHAPGGTPYDDPNATGRALLRAAEETGIRIALLDACYLHGGFGEPPDALQRRFSDGDAEAWAERVSELSGGPSARVGAAIHSVRAVDPESARVVAAWAAERSAPLHAHVSEQPAENEACLAAHGLTPSALLADAGALGARFTAVHATHVTDVDVSLLGLSRSTCCLCPTTERDLADGIGPARRLREAGACLSLGTDSHAVIDMFEEARAVELDERLATGVRGNHSAAELLRAATENGYRCLGWSEGGRIEPGALADLATLDLDGVRLAGTDHEHALGSVAFAAGAGDVLHVMVGGRFVVREGVHVSMDVASELREVI
ncbi:MAG TPA: formimidoylglutamate deiminase [Candidatus Limnocylindria bacterium]|nr:formimidoylglutamate deiminase [Candidatus Limnocylindria bacterium]